MIKVFSASPSAGETSLEKNLEFEDISLTMIVPESWRGEYAINHSDNVYYIYNPTLRESFDSKNLSGGNLFYIVCYDEPLTEEEFMMQGLDYTGYRYLKATDAHTYILYYVSDIQYDITKEEYVEKFQKMESQIKDIQFIFYDK